MIRSNRIRILMVAVFVSAILGCFASGKVIGQAANGQAAVDTFILLIDTSSSMQQPPEGWTTTKIAEVKRQLGQFCADLPFETNVIIFTFDQKPPRPGPRLVLRNEKDRLELRNFFETLKAEGTQTYAWSSLETVLGEARKQIEANPGTKIRLLMYTDGADNEKPPRDLDRILAPYTDLLKGRIKASSVTLDFVLGDDVKEILAKHNITTISVFDKNELIPLEADFGWTPNRVTTEVQMQFFDKTNASIKSIEWDFGDGTSGNGKTPVHQFQRPGNYTIRLTVTSPGGKTSTTEQTIEVLQPEPVVAAGRFFPATIGQGEAVQFISEAKGGVTEFQWEFGDGEVSNAENPSHVFAKPDEYVVKLTVSRGAESKTVELSEKVVVRGPARPETRMFAPQQGMINQPLRFVDASQGSIDSRTWNFGDGSAEETGSEATHTYREARNYTVTLRVTGPGGESETTSAVEVTAPPKPQPDFVVGVQKIQVNQPVVFVDVTRQPVTNVVWNFGDGTPEQKVAYEGEQGEGVFSVEHVFAREGSFETSLTASGPGGTGTVKKKIEVAGYAPLMCKIESVTKGRVGDTVLFTDASSGEVASATWRFGDGTDPVNVDYLANTDRSARTVRHSFVKEGDYAVILEIAGPAGTATGTIDPFRVDPSELLPRALFDFDPKSGEVPLTVKFKNQSSGQITRYLWNFGDGGNLETTDKEDVEHTYLTPGDYVPSLKVEGLAGIAPGDFSSATQIQAMAKYVPDYTWLWAMLGTFALVLAGIGIWQGNRVLAMKRELANARLLTGKLLYRDASKNEVSNEERLPGYSSFHKFEIPSMNALPGSQVVLTKTVEVLGGQPGPAKFRLEVTQANSSVSESESLEPGQEVRIGPYIVEYKE